MFLPDYKNYSVEPRANCVEHRKVDDEFSVFGKRGELFYSAEATSHSCCKYDERHYKNLRKDIFPVTYVLYHMRNDFSSENIVKIFRISISVE